ncbi:ATP-dependent DNA helicase [Candidatus Woesearchaeota archaeon]|jgi:DNA excision repair protein ERCC-2|nr:ATP-dependent DNA helicase [Candidatus Woesearchaeota archaeon]MBT7062840.1 ATP-dependent DNA helicase [Candidatus Woesearchaeota archaeon]MBT7403005.1 ATP-dependent DNA helicase [Candidatus Woesearchaeota archaeon]
MSIFPFDEVRPEQNKLMADIESAIKEGQSIIAHAPTGLGKTAAALTPALEYAIENNKTVFFLTSRNTQHTLIIETLREMNNKQKIIAVDFIGKKGMCPQMLNYDSRSINFIEFCKDQRKTKDCKLFNKTLDKNEATKKSEEFIAKLIEEGPLNVEEVVARSVNNFCAYELSMLLAQQANVIVADYYHIFSPKVRKFFLNKIKKDLANSIIIIDEAHNLPDRIRNLLTNKINTLTLSKLSNDIKNNVLEDLDVTLKDIVNRLRMYGENALGNKKEVKVTKEDFISIVETATDATYSDFIETLETISSEIEDPDNEDSITRFVEFLRSWLGKEEGFVRILKREFTKARRPFTSIEYNCLHPGALAKKVFDEVHSAILMSGTLTPTEMYRDILELKKDTLLKVYSNPFPNENRLVLVSSDITTKYEERTEQMFKKIAASCAYIINNVKGNSAIFFSSYDILAKTMIFLDKIVEKDLFIEKKGMTKAERSQLLVDFKQNLIHGGGAIIGVQGANFSEGIDLPGDLLKAVAIVGVPFAPPDLRQKAIIDYYEKNFRHGWDYGYIFPAMNRALQAAGRCIRSAEDRGIIAFLDKRFSWSKYAKIIPPDWNAQTTDYFGDKIQNFFDN